MQRLLLLLMLFAGLPVAAQEVIHNNTNGNYNTPTNSSSINTLETDTITIQSKELQEFKYDSKPAKPATQQKDRVKKIEENRKMELEEVPASSGDTQAAPELLMQQQFQTNQLNSTHQYSRRSATPIEQLNMDQSVSYYQETAPESFESHFYAWLAGHYNVDLFPNLQAASLLKPDNADVQKQLAAYYIITNQPQLALTSIEQLKTSGKLSAGQLTYARDLLVSGYEDSYIVTHGFDDMLSAYYVQQHDAIRKDVKLVSLDFLQSEFYRTEMQNAGLVLPESTMIDTAFLAAFCELNADAQLQLSMTIPRDYFAGMKNKLYPVGLTFAWSNEAGDHFEKNRSLWFSEFTETGKLAKKKNDSGDQWSNNYLPMMITLKTQLQEAGEKKEAETLRKAILELGERNGMKETVKKYAN